MAAATKIEIIVSFANFSMNSSSNSIPRVSFEILSLRAFQNYPWLPDLVNYELRKLDAKRETPLDQVLVWTK